MAISTMDGLVAGLTSGRRVPYMKYSITTAGGAWSSLWTAAGTPGAGATPPSGVGEVPTKATAGALDWTNVFPSQSYLALLTYFAGNSGSLFVYDRLVHTSGLDSTVTTAQTVNSAAITRPDANGADVECWLEIYTQIGTTPRTATVSYTNQSGTSGRSGSVAAFGGPSQGNVVARLFPVALQAGDTGVRSVQSVTLSGTTGTAGNFGVTLVRRIAEVGINSSTVVALANSIDLGLPRVYDDACVALAAFTATSSTGNLGGLLGVAVG